VPSNPPALAADALTSLLLPFWQLVIGALVLVVLAISAVRLVRRGRSRMTTAMVVTGAAVVGLAAIGMLLQSH
jgi:hypothetical protein